MRFFLGTLTLLALLHSGFTVPPPRCAAESCIKPPCNSPLITPPDECCPICPAPCSDVPCPKPRCDRPLITPAGQCCPVCPFKDIDCALVKCPLPACDNPIKLPGVCCLTCPPTPPTGDCSEVRCEKPACSNPSTPKGECCPVCPTCLAVMCPKPACDNPVLPPGECCGICLKPRPSFCLHNRRKYRIGRRVPSANRCESCRCGINGEVQCAIRRCPRLPCDNPVNVPGQCCAVCPRPTICVVGNKKYRIGSRVSPQRPCTNCFCGYDGRVRCYPVKCPKPTCDNPRNIKGHCCPVCPTPSVCIAKDGRKYRAGQSVPNSDPCKLCSCLDSGEIQCAVKTCLPSTCKNPVFIEGQCCSVCPPAGVCIATDGTQCLAGQSVPSSNPCKRCKCQDNSEIVCGILKCARPACDNAVYIEGRCCPVCPPPGVCIAKDGTRYSVGDSVPSTNPCEVCTCGSDSSIDCPIRDCPRPACDNPISEARICCPVCPLEEKCVKDGLEYGIGDTVPDDNPCSGCRCEKGGIIRCHIRDCARPDCSRPVTPPGQCCPICKRLDIEA